MTGGAPGRFEVGTSADVRAFHVMPGMPLPEGELHAHEYRIDVLVERAALDEQGMVVDLDVLDAALRALIDPLRDADLEAIRPDWADAVTVEVFARQAHALLAERLAGTGGETLSVRVWESAVAFAGYRAPLR